MQQLQVADTPGPLSRSRPSPSRYPAPRIYDATEEHAARRALLGRLPPRQDSATGAPVQAVFVHAGRALDAADLEVLRAQLLGIEREPEDPIWAELEEAGSLDNNNRIALGEWLEAHEIPAELADLLPAVPVEALATDTPPTRTSAPGPATLPDEAPATPPTLTELARRQLAAARDHFARTNGKGTLQAPTMAVGRYRAGDEVRLKSSNQRNLPGTAEQAALDGLERLAPSTNYPNMHGEMLGVLHAVDRRLAGEDLHLEEIGASQEICFQCELVLQLLGIGYDEAHVSRILYSKWQDPTGMFSAPGGGFYPLPALLEALGVRLDEARARLVARLQQETTPEDAAVLADRLLAGDLQAGKPRQGLLGSLKKVPTLKTSRGSSGASGSRSGGTPRTKAGRREKRLRDQERRKSARKQPPKRQKLEHLSDEEEDVRPMAVVEGGEAPYVTALWSRLRQERARLAALLPEERRAPFLEATAAMVGRPDVDEENFDALEIQSWEDAMMASMRERFDEMRSAT